MVLEGVDGSGVVGALVLFGVRGGLWGTGGGCFSGCICSVAGRFGGVAGLAGPGDPNSPILSGAVTVCGRSCGDRGVLGGGRGAARPLTGRNRAKAAFGSNTTVAGDDAGIVIGLGVLRGALGGSMFNVSWILRSVGCSSCMGRLRVGGVRLASRLV